MLEKFNLDDREIVTTKPSCLCFNIPTTTASQAPSFMPLRQEEVDASKKEIDI
jgi:hypothetical protein